MLRTHLCSQATDLSSYTKLVPLVRQQVISLLLYFSSATVVVTTLVRLAINSNALKFPHFHAFVEHNLQTDMHVTKL